VEVTFADWTGGRALPSLGTNAGALQLPFQTWRNFKEAFAPELVARAIRESKVPVRRCLDPFGGSGTTALACQFLGVKPVTVEVNPFLADLIAAKLASYSLSSISRSLAMLLRAANRKRVDPVAYFAAAPGTFVEPGIEGRWIFDHEVAARIASLVEALGHIPDTNNRRLLRVLLGGILAEISNVTISGKGRRYRQAWQLRHRRGADHVDESLCAAVERAASDIVRYGNRAERRYKVVRGDARRLTRNVAPVDLAIFSPPYPNSFDYTDVYNLELWALGYLSGRSANTRLRLSTLASHVQINRQFPRPPRGSRTLTKTLAALESPERTLWNRNIPAMVGGYFAEMLGVVDAVRRLLPPKGQLWMVVGDSRYSGVTVNVANILSELAPQAGCRVVLKEACRSMRSSAQQGGDATLKETLLVLCV
jgi:DNA modification methylase